MPTRHRCFRGTIIALFLVAGGCAPIRTHSRVPSSAAGKSSTSWLSKDRQGRFVLPGEVEVHLAGLDGADEIVFEDAAGERHHVVPRDVGVSLDGQTSRPTVRAAGPVRIVQGDTTVLHRGTLIMDRSPGSSGRRGLRAAVRLSMDDYIEGVVAAELPIWSAEPAELEALAIAARTFAASTIAKRSSGDAIARLEDGVFDQAYRGSYDGSVSPGTARVAKRLAAAVEATSGQVLVRGDRLEEARYHAACGGRTADFDDVFRKEAQEFDARGPRSVRCGPCMQRAIQEQAEGGPDPTRPLAWVVNLDAPQLAAIGIALGLRAPLARVVPTAKDSAGRWITVQVSTSAGESRSVPMDRVRKAAGYGVVKSALIDASSDSAGDAPSAAPSSSGAPLRLQGRGRGHGVGLCQEAARDHAKAGWSSRQILEHYYPGASVQRVGTYGADRP